MARNLPDMYEKRNSIKHRFEDVALKNPSKPKINSNKNLHEHHRERVRARFLKDGGIENFDDHNILELLLFYAIPVKDTNELAHDLINKFGSLSGVFDARIEDLCKVNGIGEKSAILIKLIPKIFQKYETDKLKKDRVQFTTADLVAKYASKYFIGLSEEQLYLMCLDQTSTLLSFTKISAGDINKTPIDMRKITETAYNVNATNLILVHNHPSGITAPSKKDIDATTAISEIIHAVGLHLSDHIILGNGDDYFSFKKSEKWKYIFR